MDRPAVAHRAFGAGRRADVLLQRAERPADRRKRFRRHPPDLSGLERGPRLSRALLVVFPGRQRGARPRGAGGRDRRRDPLPAAAIGGGGGRAALRSALDGIPGPDPRPVDRRAHRGNPGRRGPGQLLRQPASVAVHHSRHPLAERRRRAPCPARGLGRAPASGLRLGAAGRHGPVHTRPGGLPARLRGRRLQHEPIQVRRRRPVPARVLPGERRLFGARRSSKAEGPMPSAWPPTGSGASRCRRSTASRTPTRSGRAIRRIFG